MNASRGNLQVKVEWWVVIAISFTAIAAGAIGWWIDRAALSWSLAMLLLLSFLLLAPAVAMAGTSVRLRIDPARPRVGETVRLVVGLRVAVPFVPATWRGVFLDDFEECRLLPTWRKQVEQPFDLPVRRRGHIGRSARLVVTGPGRVITVSRRIPLEGRGLGMAWPRLVRPPVPTPRSRALPGCELFSVGGDEGDTSGARPYRRGVAFRAVHWIATARQGELIVRDRHAASRRSTTVLLAPSVLDEPIELREEGIARFAGTVQSLLEDGYMVVTHAGKHWRELRAPSELPGFLDEVAVLNPGCPLPRPARDDLVIGVDFSPPPGRAVHVRGPTPATERGGTVTGMPVEAIR